MSKQPINQKSVALECPACQSSFRISYESTQKFTSAKCSRCGFKFKIADAIKKAELSLSESAYLKSTDLGGEILGEDSQESSDLFMNPDELATFQKKRRNASKKQTNHEQAIEEDDDDDWLSAEKPDTSLDSEIDWNDDSNQNYVSQTSKSKNSVPLEDEWDQLTNDNTLNELPHVSEIEEQKKKTTWVTKLFLFIWACMFLGILAVIAYGSLTHPIWLEKVYRFFNLSLHEILFTDDKINTYEITNIHGRMKLYVVEGKLINQFATENKVSWIQLKGITIDANGKMLETAIVFAGNVLTKKQLAEQQPYQIKKFYKFPNGQDNANHELKEEQIVPFQMVFYESSQKLRNVSVKIISYVKDNQTVYPQLLENH